MMSFSRSAIKLIIAVETYFVFTVLLYAGGPLKWHNSIWRSVTLSLIFYAFFGIGYVIRRENVGQLLSAKTFPDMHKHLFIVGGCIALIVYWERYKLFGGNVLDAFKLSIGELYVAAHREELPASKSMLYRLATLAWGASFFFYTIALSSWHKLRTGLKLFALIVIGSMVFTYFLTGTMKSLADLLILFICSRFLSGERKGAMLPHGGRKKRRKKYAVTIMLSSVLGLALFFEVQIARMKAHGISLDDYYGEGAISYFADFSSDSVLYKALGPISYLLDTYFGHSYYGLELGLRLPFQGTWGIGSSRALTEYYYQLTGDKSIAKTTLPQRIEDAYLWPNGQFWPTAFVWWASDVPFAAIPLIMFFLGYVFRGIWNRAIRRGNLLDKTVFAYYCIFLFYLPLNNQFFQAKSSLHATHTILLLMLWDWVKRNPIAISRDVLPAKE